MRNLVVVQSFYVHHVSPRSSGSNNSNRRRRASLDTCQWIPFRRITSASATGKERAVARG